MFQFLEEEGLTKYVDSKLLRREIQESMEVTEEELERAAQQLIQIGSASPPRDSHAHAHELYEDALGAIELQHFNQPYSSSALASQTRTDVVGPSALRHHPHQQPHHSRISPRFDILRSSSRAHRSTSPARALHLSHPHHLDTSDDLDLDYADDVKDYVTTL